LVSAKIPVLQSVQLTKKMIDFYPMQVALQKIENRLLEGAVLSTCLAEHAIFDRKMIALVKVAEETNQNEFVFKRLTTQYNEDVQQQSKILTTILEPLIIVFLGIVVALVLIAMYMPMFQLSTVIG
jgi:type II secretory pathway component PulF